MATTSDKETGTKQFAQVEETNRGEMIVDEEESSSVGGRKGRLDEGKGVGSLLLKNSTRPSMPSFGPPSLKWRVHTRRK